MNRHLRSWLVMGLWLCLLATCSMLLSRHLRLSSDLRLFLPDPETPAERILLKQLKDGPGTRLLLASLSGSDSANLAAVSDQLATSLRSNTLFTRIENGSLHADSKLQELVTRYRYLLSTTAFDTQSLHSALQERLQDMSSPAGGIAQDWLLRDPTGELEKLVTAWQGSGTPQLIDGVWFDRVGEHALLLLQTRAPGFDAEQQRTALAAIDTELRRLDPAQHLKLQLTGPGAFTALMEQSIRGDITTIGIAEGVASLLFLMLVLWSVRHVVLGTLTLATAGAGALAGMVLLYPSVHGITLAFGFTLLGVAMDYPVHSVLHLQRDQSAAISTRIVWPTLRLSIATTCIAYLALTFGGFTGLAQLGTFTVLGLLATGVVIRWLLPYLMSPAAARAVPAWVVRTRDAPRMRVLPLLLIALSATVLLLSKQPVWNNELSSLTPVPRELQDMDEALRRELGAPDLRYVLAVRAADQQAALQRDEALSSGLQQLQQQGVIGSYQQPGILLPSEQLQLARRAQLPDAMRLQQQLDQALASLPFRADAFGDFLTDVEASRTLTPLRVADLAGTPLADRLGATLFDTGEESIALITLSDAQNTQALAAWTVAQGNDVLLLDLKAVSEQLVERFRARAMLALGAALALIAALMLWQLSRRAALAVLLPVLATLLLEVAILNALGISLTLFHVVSLLLVAGLCFDYGLFFNRSEANDEEALRTRFSVMACWLSTTGSFGLLLISQLPVLRAIGYTVSLGVTLGFCIALLARHDEDVAS